MLFNSASFLIFFPIVVLLYYVFPHKVRYILVLLASFYFYMSWEPAYGILLASVILLSWIIAVLIEKCKSGIRTKKRMVALFTVICMGLLLYFKYSNFAIDNLNKLLQLIRISKSINHFSIILPIGISFYSFQALAYVIDVSRGKVKAEKNLLLYAAFISFFPQLVAGPIERADHFLNQFKQEHHFDYEKVKHYLLVMLWGFFMKIVVADRIAIYVDTVYGNYEQYGGWLLILASVLFAFQIYCDFAGYSTIAIGAAGVMGFELMENFKSPYCAAGIRDFWARWHISLTGWFRDYVYIPLGGNRKGKFRKMLNTLIVFMLSGLWHGANWSYVVWGGLNGCFIILEDCISGYTNGLKNALFEKSKICKVIRRIGLSLLTFFAVDITWVFFRAPGTKEAVQIFKNMFPANNFSAFFDNTVHFYIMEKHVFVAMLISLIVIFVIDFLHYRNIFLINRIKKLPTAIQWFIYIVSILTVLIFGVWGPDFDASAFIYFQF